MLLYQISDIDYVPKNTQLQLRISTIRGRLADGARCAAVRSYQFDQRSETEFRIQLNELLFDDGSLFKVIDEKKSRFTRMEVLDQIYHQFFLSANSLGRQPTTSQYFQPLTPRTSALAAARIHCALSEYASGEKATVMFSEDEYRGTFCPSPVINFTPEATALINHMKVGRLIPSVRCHCARIGAPQFPSVLLSLD